MSKIIVHNESSFSDVRAMQFVTMVMNRGFESGENQYCWVTTWERYSIEVHAMKTRGNTFTFKVINFTKD